MLGRRLATDFRILQIFIFFLGGLRSSISVHYCHQVIDLRLNDQLESLAKVHEEVNVFKIYRQKELIDIQLGFIESDFLILLL